jgi:hypothetical protein
MQPTRQITIIDPARPPKQLASVAAVLPGASRRPLQMIETPGEHP